MPNPPLVTFDPATRAAQFVEVVVTQNSVDQTTGANPGAVDTVSPLVFSYLSGAASGSVPAYATIAEVGQTSSGARILQITPGVVPIGTPFLPNQTTYLWSIRVSAAGRTGTVTFNGQTPPIADVSGVAWNGIGPTITQPT